LLYLPISAFAELWAIPFLQASYGLDEKTASYAQMSLYLMSGLGGPLLAALAERWKSYIKVLKMVAIVECVLFGLMTMTSFFSYKAVIGISSFVGLFLGGQVLVFSVVKSQCSKDELGSAYAFTNAIVMAFGMIFQPLLGKILQAAWATTGGGYVDGAPLYRGEVYSVLILALVAAFLVSLCALYWTNDTYVSDEVSEK
jgi:MFS family permease